MSNEPDRHALKGRFTACRYCSSAWHRTTTCAGARLLADRHVSHFREQASGQPARARRRQRRVALTIRAAGIRGGERGAVVIGRMRVSVAGPPSTQSGEAREMVRPKTWRIITGFIGRSARFFPKPLVGGCAGVSSYRFGEGCAPGERRADQSTPAGLLLLLVLQARARGTHVIVDFDRQQPRRMYVRARGESYSPSPLSLFLFLLYTPAAGT